MSERLRPAPACVRRAILALAVVSMLAGCEWVDSAGGGDGETTTIQFDDPGGTDLLAAEEASTLRLVARLDNRAENRVWRWTAVPTGADEALAACLADEAVPEGLAVPSLEAACTTEGCELVFDEQPPTAAELEVFGTTDASDGADVSGAEIDPASVVAFDIDVPLLQAPVALRYELSAVEGDGVVATDVYDFCLRSVNDPPVAVDDRYSVLEGAPLIVGADDDAPDLLANDRDDLDAANEPLRVLTEPARAPSGAARFELGADGGFRYVFAGTDLGEDITDRFDYTITDGTFESTATVTIRIVARDDPPELIRAIPTLLVTAGVEFEAELNDYFQDPDGATLSFSATNPRQIPPGFALDESGLLSGTAPQEAVGDYTFDIGVGDGRFELEEPVALEVLENLPILAATIPAQQARANRRVRFSAARYFDDPEAQPITYTLEARDPALDLDIGPTTGVVSGFVSTRGVYRLSIVADDGVSSPTTADFVLSVR